MAKGDGSISAVKDKCGNVVRNRWRVSLSFGVNPITGKPNRITRIVNGTKVEARRVRDELRRQYDQGLEFSQSQTTFSEMSKLWTQSRYTTGAASETTIKLDAQRLKHVEALIGNMALKSITVPVLEKTFAMIKEKRNLSNTTMHELHGIVKRVFSKAVDYDIILRNPCDKIKAPRKSNPDRKSLQVEDAVKLLAFVDEYERNLLEEFNQKEERHFMRGLHDISCIMAVRIGLATGQRRGEVFALTWGDVDLDEGTIHVGHNVTYQDVVKTPKTDSGVRTIAIDPTTVEHLSMWKDRQAEELAKICVKQTDETPVCCSSTGGRIRIDNFSHWWGDLAQGTRLRRAQVPRAPAHTGHIAPRQRRRRQDRPDQARPRQRKHHARLVRPRHPAERPRSGNDARQPAQQQARGRRTERPAGKRCSDPRRIIPVAPSREPSQCHGRRLEGGIRKQASSSN